MPYFSVIVPVYNRRDEVEDLLRSLTQQTDKDFEIILVEDGSTDPCEDIALRYSSELDLRYFYKANEGRSIARNYGLEHATGKYFVFFDSDCVIPPDYFKTLGRELASSRPTISRRWAVNWPTTMCLALAAPTRRATTSPMCRRPSPSR